MAELKENAIEWLNGQDTITLTLNQGKYINKVKRLASKFPDRVKIVAENSDGSLCAKLPLSALKLNMTEPRELTEEQREANAKRLAEARANK